MKKRWQQVRSIILSYLATIIGLPVIYSFLDQQLPIFSGFTDTWRQTIVFTFCENGQTFIYFLGCYFSTLEIMGCFFFLAEKLKNQKIKKSKALKVGHFFPIIFI
ncbi:hypothetical protein [Enterococcus sp. AZ050]|uniref:hypothetical protein n=1 Tax=Enterococcus sp. AZ050 TaxID=2774696 RepID=UPI003F1E779F